MEQVTPTTPSSPPTWNNNVSIVLSKILSSRKCKIGLSLWAIGLFIMLFMPALYVTLPSEEAAFTTSMEKAMNIDGYASAVEDWNLEMEELGSLKVWFWRFRSPYDQQVTTQQERVNEAYSLVLSLEMIRDEMMNKAKSKIGLWSSYGLLEARDRFWKAYEAGKVFAQRQTFYQLFFSLFESNSRDNSLITNILSWIMKALLNFTFGLLGSLFYFSFTLLSLIVTYQPSVLSGMVFYTAFLIGAAAVVITALVSIYTMTASGVYILGKAAMKQARLQEEQKARLRHPHAE